MGKLMVLKDRCWSTYQFRKQEKTWMNTMTPVSPTDFSKHEILKQTFLEHPMIGLS